MRREEELAAVAFPRQNTDVRASVSRISYVEYGESKDEGEACLTFDRRVDGVDYATSEDELHSPGFLLSVVDE